MRNPTRLKALGVFGGVALIAILVLLWLYNRSTLEIRVQNASAGNITYRVLDQRTRKVTEVTSSDKSARITTGKSSYEVLVKQNEKTHFTVISTKGFFGKTTVLATIESEHKREFIGNNPLPCMHYTQNILLSFECSGSFAAIQVHTPATATTPTSSSKPSRSETGISNVAITSAGDMVLVREAVQGDEGGTSYWVYPLSSDLKLENGRQVNELANKEEDYKLASYSGGFIVYNQGLSDVLYFSSLVAAPERLQIDKPTGEGMTGHFLSSNTDKVLLVYSNVGEEEKADLHGENKNITSELVYFDGNSTRHYEINDYISTAHLCGSNKLCVLVRDELVVYEAGAEKLKKEFSLTGVDALEQFDRSLVVVRQTDMLNLDVDKKYGFVGYSFGDYTYCGIAIQKTTYTVCLINGGSDKVALLVSREKPNDDSIDKKVSKLLETEGVNNLSVYRNFIHVSPELGDAVYDPETGFFGYDKVKKQSVDSEIRQQAERIGIDLGVYRIINAFD